MSVSLYGRKQNRIWLAELVIIKIIRLWQYLVITKLNCNSLTLSKCHTRFWRTNFPPLDKAGGKHVAMSEPGSSWETSRTAAAGLEGEKKVRKNLEQPQGSSNMPWTKHFALTRLDSGLNLGLVFFSIENSSKSFILRIFNEWKFWGG